MSDKKHTLIIDGYNLIGKIPELNKNPGHSLELERSVLIKKCREWKSKHKECKKIYVVFDGDSTVGPFPSTSHRDPIVLFSKTGEEADSVILRLISGFGDTEITVVSDDSDLLMNARLQGAHTMRNAEFRTLPSEVIKKKSRKSGITDDSEKLPADQKKKITSEMEGIWLTDKTK